MKKEAQTFEEAVKPLMKWLCENKHPHTTAIVTGNVAELVEGVEVVKTDEFIVDKTKRTMKQTAVEYYNQEIKELFNMHQDGEISGKMFHMSRLVALTKAKEMEKEQIIDAYYQGDADSDNIHVDAEQYYNETFKSE